MKPIRLCFVGILIPLLAHCHATALAADVSYYSVVKLQSNVQTNSSTPVPTLRPYNYKAQVRAAAQGSVSYATVNFRFMTMAPQDAMLSIVNDSWPSQSSLDVTHPSGSQNFSISTLHNGTTNLTLSLPSGSYPIAPHFSDFSSMQAIDPSVSFTVNWDASTGGNTNDLIELQILNGSGVVFDSGAVPKASGALDGTATGVTVPAGTLMTNRNYIGRLMFARVLSTNNAYAPGFAAYAQQTDVYMSTLGGVPPALVSVVPPPGTVGVPANAKITLVFNKTMLKSSSIGVSGTTNSFTNDWSADGRTLTISSAFQWPATLLTWIMNPASAPPLLSDTNSNPIMTETIATAFTPGANLLPATPLAPTLRLASPSGNGTMQVQLTGGEAYRVYELQFSPDLLNWTNLGAIQAADSTAVLTDPSPAPTNRNYRVQVMP
jgi:hypothetical protein